MLVELLERVEVPCAWQPCSDGFLKNHIIKSTSGCKWKCRLRVHKPEEPIGTPTYCDASNYEVVPHPQASGIIPFYEINLKLQQKLWQIKFWKARILKAKASWFQQFLTRLRKTWNSGINLYVRFNTGINPNWSGKWAHSSVYEFDEDQNGRVQTARLSGGQVAIQIRAQ